MQVQKWVTLEGQVEVGVGIDDIVATIQSKIDPEDETMEQCIERGLNNALMFLKGVPDENIKAAPAALRKVWAGVLREEAQRYGRLAE